MAQKVNVSVAKVSPNLYSAAVQSNLDKSQIGQIEQFSWTVSKNKDLLRMPTDKARNEFANLDDEVQEKLRFLYPNAAYTEEPETLKDNFFGVIKGAGKVLASPLIGVLKVAGVYNRVINLPYLVGRQVSQGEGLWNKQTWTDAWDGRRVYDNGALAEVEQYFGKEKTAIAKGILAGKKPGEIVESYGTIDDLFLKAMEEAYNSPDTFRQVLDGVKYAQVSLGRDIARDIVGNKSTKFGGVTGDYVSGKTKNLSGGIDFFYQLLIDPLTYLTGGLNKGLTQADNVLNSVKKYGSAGVKEIFEKDTGVVKLWDEQIGPRVQKLIDAPTPEAKTAARIDIKNNFEGWNSDKAIKILEDNKLTDAETAKDYFSQVENVTKLLSGRVDGMQFWRTGVDVAGKHRRLTDWTRVKVAEALMPPTKDAGKKVEDINAVLKNPEGTDVNAVLQYRKQELESSRSRKVLYKISEAIARTPQGGMIKIGDDAIETAETFRLVARQIMPRDLAEGVTHAFVNADISDQVIILRNLYLGVMQRYGLDGLPGGERLIRETLTQQFGATGIFGAAKRVSVDKSFSAVMGKTWRKVDDDAGNAFNEVTGAVQFIEETNAISTLDYIKLAETAYNMKSRKNLLHAMGGATNSHTANKFVNAWTIMTLFPRLGIRSSIDEGFLYTLTAPSREIFQYLSRKGHKLGRAATAFTASKSAETLTRKVKTRLGVTTAETALDTTRRREIIEALAAEKGIEPHMLDRMDVAEAVAKEAITFAKIAPNSDEGRYMIQLLTKNPDFLDASTKSIGSTSSVLGRVSPDVQRELLPMSELSKTLDKFELIRGVKGTTVSVDELRKVNAEYVAVAHLENITTSIVGNTKFIYSKANKKVLINPGQYFLEHNAIKTEFDFVDAVNGFLADLGIFKNKALYDEVGDEVARQAPDFGYIATDERLLKEFIGRSAHTTALRNQGYSDIEIARDKAENMLADIYEKFHGVPMGKGYNKQLYDAVNEKYGELLSAERVGGKPISKKWNKALGAIKFDDFVKLTDGFQPQSEVFTSLQIEGLTTDFENVLTKLGNNAMDLMDAQVTAIFRQPVVFLSYMKHRKAYAKLEEEFRVSLVNAELKAAREAGQQIDDVAYSKIVERTRDIAEKRFTEIAADSAANNILKYADNPNIRTNFALSARTVGRFYRATEDFWRRMYRLKDVSPRVLYRMRLAHLGLNASGMVYKDGNDDAYVMMPMDGVIFQAIDTATKAATGQSAFKQPMFNEFTFKLKLANPSFSPDAGLPMLSGPIGALSVLSMKSVLGIFGAPGKQLAENADNYLLGSMGDSTTWFSAVIPGTLQRVWTALPFDEKDRQASTAAMQAIAYNASQGNYLKPDATEEEKYDYLKAIRLSAHNIVAMRSLLGLISPIAPSTQESVGVPDYLRSVGIAGLRPEFYDILNAISDKFQGDVQDPFELAIATFVGRNPGKLVYTVARDERETNVVIQKTKELKGWMINNKSLVDTYGEAAYIFAPNTGDFDVSTYNWLEGADLISNKSLEKYYRDILVANDRKAYYDIANQEKDLLASTADVFARKAIINNATNARAALKGSNPLLNAALVGGGSEIATEERMLRSLEEMLVGENLSISKELKSKMLLAVRQVRDFVALSNDADSRKLNNFSDVKRKRKAEIEAMIADMSAGDATMREANRAVFRAILDFYSRDSYTVYGKGY